MNQESESSQSQIEETEVVRKASDQKRNAAAHPKATNKIKTNERTHLPMWNLPLWELSHSTTPLDVALIVLDGAPHRCTMCSEKLVGRPATWWTLLSQDGVAASASKLFYSERREYWFVPC